MFDWFFDFFDGITIKDILAGFASFAILYGIMLAMVFYARYICIV